MVQLYYLPLCHQWFVPINLWWSCDDQIPRSCIQMWGPVDSGRGYGEEGSTVRNSFYPGAPGPKKTGKSLGNLWEMDTNPMVHIGVYPKGPWNQDLTMETSAKCEWFFSLPETDIFAPENGWVEDDRFLLGWLICRGYDVTFREGIRPVWKSFVEDRCFQNAGENSWPNSSIGFPVTICRLHLLASLKLVEESTYQR